MDGLYSQMNLIGNALRGTAQQHEVLSQNIANVNTPGYKTRRVEFDEMLQRLASSDAQREAIEDVDVIKVEGLPARVDGNNVNMENEVAELKKNALVAQSYAQLLSSKIAMMRNAISG